MNEQLKVIISAETAKFKQNVDNAKKSVKDFANEGKQNFQALNEEFQKVGDLSKRVIGIMAGAVAGAATALMALGQSTKEYRQQQGMLQTAFEAAGGSADMAKNTYNDLYRVLGDGGKATEAAQHLAKLTTEEKALSEWTNICQGVYATFGESLPVESLTEAVNHSAKLGEVQGTLADALEWSGVNVDEFNDQLFWCNSESEREKLIRETLNGLYSEAADGYEKNNEAILKQNEAQAKLTEAQAKLGEATTPIMTMLTELATDILGQLTPHILEVEKHLPAIKDFLLGVADAIGAVINWLADNWDLVSNLAIYIGSIATALSVLSTVMGVVNSVMLVGNPILLAVAAAIGAMTAVIIIVVKNWDSLKAAAVGAWEKIKSVWGVVANWFNEKIIQPVKTAFGKLTDLMSKPISKAKDLIKGIIDKIKGFFKFEWSLPKLKVPKFAITPSGWKIGDLLQGVIPKLGITWNARGGVFDKPTVFNYGNSLQGIGENGAEAVVPLENNLEWLNKLAGMLADRMKPAPVVLQVDGKTFAKTAISSINDLTRQQGKLSLNLV